MSLEIEQKRMRIAEMYESPFWKDRVSRMPPAQVAAIYKSFKERGRFDKVKKKKEEWHQMTLFEMDGFHV